MRRSAWLVGCLLGSSLTASAAQAFSEPLLYQDDPINGGGGGRFFTGSPLDGYSCAVCHQGAAPPNVTLSGLPKSFEPGMTYDIVLSWTTPTAPHGLNLEIVDVDGRAAGELALPKTADLTADDRCTFTEDPIFKDKQASYLVETGTRNIVGVRACGARSLHFSFTAPDTAKIALTASIVRSDESKDVKGDGVRELRQISYRGNEFSQVVSGSGCGVIAQGRSALPWSLLLALTGFLFARRLWLSRARSRVSANRG